MPALLAIRRLEVHLPAEHGEIPVVAGIDLDLDRGQRLALVGESGSGKSMTALAVMGLLPRAARARGSIALDSRELLGLDDHELAALRGQRMAMVFQEPMTALNPVHTIGHQIGEAPLRLGMARAEVRDLVRASMARVGLDPGHISPDRYPHQLSGGQRQRVMLAMALATDPDLLIADEPTTALDVTVQARILRLIDGIVEERGMALLLITHDLGVVAAMAERVAVMRAGRIVESGSVENVLRHPAAAHTRRLLAARLPEVGTTS
ncbi:MAG TPA: ABC transporter ATP-binding protein [Geminicoccaceae bacterium]|nr:ABC transporter ATP-binding protein [Geminicoccus sp.]HMU50068.1 ABC transporter ATP-binding protein [Geminicoccaceae bacterium]